MFVEKERLFKHKGANTFVLTELWLQSESDDIQWYKLYKYSCPVGVEHLD